MHGKTSEERFRRFVDVQMLWDEHMARVARDYLHANPDKHLVVLAGSGHIAHPDAIPGRLARMLAEEYAVVVTGPSERFDGGSFDFRLAERAVELPPRGRLGVALASDADRVTLSAINPGSPAAATGLRPGDRILSIAGERIADIDDVILALLDRGPGEEVWVEIERPGDGGAGSRIAGAVTLF
jgi:C-terminal processing protease CtpA/Prc